MPSAVRQSDGDALRGMRFTMRDDVEALSSRDQECRGVPRILSAFDGPAWGGSAGSDVGTVSTPCTDRNDAMRLRIQVDRSGWPALPEEHEKNSDRWSR